MANSSFLFREIKLWRENDRKKEGKEMAKEKGVKEREKERKSLREQKLYFNDIVKWMFVAVICPLFYTEKRKKPFPSHSFDTHFSSFFILAIDFFFIKCRTYKAKTLVSLFKDVKLSKQNPPPIKTRKLCQITHSIMLNRAT